MQLFARILILENSKLMKSSYLLPATLWISSQAGGSLFLASSAWMVSGLTSSPLINSLIPVIAAIPILVDIRERLGGYWLQAGSILGLLIASWFYSDDGISKSILLGISFIAIFSYYLGIEVSSIPLQKELMSNTNVRLKTIQICTELGSLLGAAMTALIFPAVSQFIPAFILILPLASIVYRKKGHYLEVNDKGGYDTSHERNVKLSKLPLLQGFVLGGMFAVLALWVRLVDGGKCFDFGIILASYFLGKGLASILPKMRLSYKYILIFSLLIAFQLITMRWISVLLFVPLGMFINSTDLSIASTLSKDNQLMEGWKSFQDQSALGGIAGGLALGGICQFIGLEYALPIVSSGFVLLAILSTEKRLKLTI